MKWWATLHHHQQQRKVQLVWKNPTVRIFNVHTCICIIIVGKYAQNVWIFLVENSKKQHLTYGRVYTQKWYYIFATLKIRVILGGSRDKKNETFSLIFNSLVH